MGNSGKASTEFSKLLNNSDAFMVTNDVEAVVVVVEVVVDMEVDDSVRTSDLSFVIVSSSADVDEARANCSEFVFSCSLEREGHILSAGMVEEAGDRDVRGDGDDDDDDVDVDVENGDEVEEVDEYV